MNLLQGRLLEITFRPGKEMGVVKYNLLQPGQNDSISVMHIFIMIQAHCTPLFSHFNTRNAHLGMSIHHAIQLGADVTLPECVVSARASTSVRSCAYAVSWLSGMLFLLAVFFLYYLYIAGDCPDYVTSGLLF